MAKTNTLKNTKKRKRGRPKGSKSVETRRWEYTRDNLYPTMALAYDIDDPNAAVAKWMNESQENKDWYMKEAIRTMNDRKTTREMSDREYELKKLEIDAITQAAKEDNSGGGNTVIYAGALAIPNTPNGQLGPPAHVEDIIDVQVDEIEPKQITKKPEQDCLD